VTSEAIFSRFKDDPDDILNYFRDVSTFGGCTSGPAAALENLRILEDENLVENARVVGDYLNRALRGLSDTHSVVGDVRGLGLLQGVELVVDRDSKAPVSEQAVKQVVAECKARGVLIGAINRAVPGLNTTLCLAPALIATTQDADNICKAIDESLTTVFG